ncbi:MAG: MBOAT family protein [Lachnospiraceae bacterium]|nr:MBOAT family protein [Lachnospiraceae bacterium]
MTFLTLPFAIFFAVTMLLLILVKQQRPRQVILLLASYFFYAYWDVRFLLLLIFQCLVVYIGARLICQSRGRADASKGSAGKLWVTISIVLCLGVLGFFKYFHFFTGGYFDALTIILPVGISFYTFQSISYVVDIYRGKLLKPQSFLKVSLYISFFPQLMAGPIVRSTAFFPQLDTNPAITKDNFEKGAQIFLMGAIKKAVIADRLAVGVDAVFAAPMAYSWSSILCAVLAYSIQLYCDFSGYSDMAIGVAKAMGYDLTRNFNVPYLSANVTEFWKRWHISLSSWLQEYLYISLGGNRKGQIRTYVNLLLTMVLGGLWHGASFNFIIWGALHGLALVVHKLFMKLRKVANGDLAVTSSGAAKLFSILGTYIFVSICWVFFRAPSLDNALTVLGRLFTFADGVQYVPIFFVLYGLAILLIHLYLYFKEHAQGRYIFLDFNKFWPKVFFILVILMALAFFYHGNGAFIYFQF